MHSGRSLEVQDSVYHRDNDENLISRSREPKYYSHAFADNGYLAGRAVSEDYMPDQGLQRSVETGSRPQEFSDESLHNSQPHQYAPVLSQSDNFTMPARRGNFDKTGQQCPPGGNPRVSTTIWEDEGTLCFQVEALQMTVARREGKHSSPHKVRWLTFVS